MKCPKCGYLGFEHVERCRNCGYDFLLSRSAGLPELPIRQASSEPSPLADLELVDRTARPDTADFASEMDKDLDRVLAMTAPLDLHPAAPPAPVTGAAALRPVQPPPAPVAPAAPPPRLPLFSSASAADDVPLITRPSAPRQPLAVRRATPEASRLRGENSRAPSMDLPLDLDEPKPARAASAPSGAQHSSWGRASQSQEEGETATAGARIAAVVIDLVILAAIDVAVVYLTMQICAVSLSELALVPKAPLLAFLLVQNGGYLVAFTVGGQTVGKMAAGIKVVPADSEGTLDVGHAVLRTVLWVVLAVPAGLGFVSAFFGRDFRGLHDRLAGTRVVRASA